MKTGNKRAAIGCVLAVIGGATSTASASGPLEGTYAQTSVKNPASDNDFFVHRDKIRVRIDGGEVDKFKYRFSGECNQVGPTGGNIVEFSAGGRDKFDVDLEGDRLFFGVRYSDSIFGTTRIALRGHFRGRVLKGTFRARSLNRATDLRCGTSKIRFTAKLP